MTEEAEGETVDLATISRQVHDLTDLAAGIESRMADENQLTKERIDGQNRLAKWAIGVGAVGVAIGLIALVSVGISVETQHDFHASTQTARAGSCMQQRVSAKNTIAAADDHDLKLAELLIPSANRTPAQQRAVAAGLAKLHESSVDKNPLRLCTAAGIADFLSGRGGYETTTTPPVATTSTVP